MNLTDYQRLVELSQERVYEEAKTLEGVLTTGKTFEENRLNGDFASDHLTYVIGINDVLRLVAKMNDFTSQNVKPGVTLSRDTFAAEFHYTKKEF